MTTNELATALKALADAQRAEAAAAAAADTAAAAVKATPEGQARTGALAAHVAARQAVMSAETAARAAILAEYEATGNKQPAPGAGVRIRLGNLELVDRIAGLAWAEQHMPIAVIKTPDADLLAAWASRQPALPTWMTRQPDKATPTVAGNLAELYPEEL
jgi:hypothetical protein